MWYSPARQTGVAALAVVLLLSVLGLMLGLYSANVARTEIKMAVDDNAGNRALDIAQAGLAAAARLIVTHGVPDDELASNGVGAAGSGLAGIGSIQSLDGTSYRFAAFGGGANDGYYVRVTDNHDETSGVDDSAKDVDNTLNVISVGVVGDARRTVQGTLLHLPTKWGIYAYNGLSLSGLGKLKAWNSTATDTINVGSSGNMSLVSGTVVQGNLQVGGNLTMSGLATARNVMVAGDVSVTSGSAINGTLTGGGSLYMSGTTHAGNTVVAGNVTLASGAAINGTLMGGGSLNMSGTTHAGNTVVVGNVKMVSGTHTGTLDTSGNLTMSGLSNTKSVQVGGNVTMSSAAKIKGNAAVDGTIATSGIAGITGTISSPASPASPDSPELTFSAPPPKTVTSACGPPYSDGSGITLTSKFSVSGGYNPTSGDLTGSSYDVITLAPGAYCLHNFSLASLAQLKTTGPTVLNLTGSWTMSGLTTTAKDSPANLVVNVYGGGAVKLASASQAYMVVNAPDSTVTVSGLGDLYGGVTANNIHVVSGASIFQDLSLALNGGSVSDLLSNWHQVQ